MTVTQAVTAAVTLKNTIAYIVSYKKKGSVAGGLRKHSTKGKRGNTFKMYLENNKKSGILGFFLSYCNLRIQNT